MHSINSCLINFKIKQRQHSSMKADPDSNFQIQLVTLDDIKQQELKNHAKEEPNKKVINSEHRQRYKSKTRKIIIGLIISLSALMFGYSLKEITSVPMKILMTQYSIPIASSLAQSILIGVLPLGGCIGSIFTICLMKKYTRLTGIFIFTIVNVTGIVLVNITYFPSFVVGRFIQGISIGFYSAIAPVYLREIAPKQLRRLLGLFFSLGKMVGVLIVIFLELILQAAHVGIFWRIILSMTAAFSILQSVLIYFFGSDTPVEMIQKGQPQKARQIIERFYHEEFVQQVLQEYQRDYQIQKAKEKSKSGSRILQLEKKEALKERKKRLQNKKSLQSIQMKKINKHQNWISESESQAPQNVHASSIHSIRPSSLVIKKQKGMGYQQKKKLAYWMGIHLCVIRHLIGGNTIISQSGLFVSQLNAQLGNYTSLIINLIQFVAIVIGMVYISNRTGKRNLFLISVSMLSLLDFGIAIAMIYENLIFLFAFICLYMIVYGGAFISPIWAYPSEVIPAGESLGANIAHWLALAFSTLIPPIVAGKLDGNPYPCFFFFGIYGIFGFYHIVKSLRQSDGYTYEEIIKRFR